MNTECEPVIIFFDPVFLVRDRDTEWGGGVSVLDVLLHKVHASHEDKILSQQTH